MKISLTCLNWLLNRRATHRWISALTPARRSWHHRNRRMVVEKIFSPFSNQTTRKRRVSLDRCFAMTPSRCLALVNTGGPSSVRRVSLLPDEHETMEEMCETLILAIVMILWKGIADSDEAAWMVCSLLCSLFASSCCLSDRSVVKSSVPFVVSIVNTNSIFRWNISNDVFWNWAWKRVWTMSNSMEVSLSLGESSIRQVMHWSLRWKSSSISTVFTYEWWL